MFFWKKKKEEKIEKNFKKVSKKFKNKKLKN